MKTDLFSAAHDTVYFCDFDGTISEQDVMDALMERFALPGYKELDEEFLKGNIGSRECIEQQFALFRGTMEQLRDYLDSLKIDESFCDFVRWAEQMQHPVIILSDGFDIYIERLLNRHRLDHLPVYCNRAIVRGDRMTIEFPYYHPDCPYKCFCGNCKPSHLERLSAREKVYVGDGPSDRNAAAEVDRVYAKKRLKTILEEKGVPHIPFETFEDVLKYEKQLTECHVAEACKEKQP